MIIVKQLHTNYSLLIALDLCRPHYQNSFVYLSGKLRSNNCIACKSKLGYISFKDDQLIFRCFECKKNYQKDFDKDLIDRYASTCRFVNENMSKFILLLRKVVYPYEYMDSWEKLNQTLLPDKKVFYSELYLKDITDKDYTHAQKMCLKN